MDPSFVLLQVLNGLATTASLFITASGLTIVFGVTRIVNFAHGSFYMLGAYIAATLVPQFLRWSYGPATFWVGILASALIVGFFGLLMEVLLLRRLYRAPELFQLLATFGVMLVTQDLVIKVFGPEDILGPRAPGLKHSIEILGHRFPTYELALIAAGPIVLGLLWLLLRKTRFGMLVRAATQDRQMVGALGVNQALLFTATLFLGSFLAGLGGALQIPKAPANLGMDVSIIAEAFVVTVIGGMGSIPGAFLGALLIGELHAFGILIFPKITLILVFLLMAAVLVVRPWGLLGRPEDPHVRGSHDESLVRPWGRWQWRAAGCVVLALGLLPIIADTYLLKLTTEVLIFGLFALSLHLLIGTGGLVSFGHAAFFGLGAYGAALVSLKLGSPMEFALFVGPLVAAAAAALFGAFIIRLAGIYLAMLTLAVAQILYAFVFQSVDFAGGDNGLIGIWPSAWAASRVVYYYITLVLTVLATAVLRIAISAPFGYALRAARDSTARARAIGVDVRNHRWLAFILAGAAAGLAGSIYVFSKGSTDPTVMSIPMSVDALIMILLGGVQTFIGPLVGASALHLLKDTLMPLTDFWRLIFGFIIIGLVLVFPKGLVGSMKDVFSKWGSGSAGKGASCY